MTDVARPFLTPTGVYVAGGLRLVLGIALLLTASTSGAPRTLRVLGGVVIVAGVVTPLVGVDRARAIVDWWTGQGTALTRLWAAVAVALSLFLGYTVRQPAHRP